MFGGNDTPAKPPSRRRVLKPPGGGSSDIFGTSAHDPEPQQRKTKTNHLTSSIFGGEDAQTPARKPGNDSFYNLFGAEPQSQSRPGTAVKDKFKSNIVLDEAEVNAKKSLTFSEDRTEMDNGTSQVLVKSESVNGVENTNTQRNGVHNNGTEDDGEKEEANQATTNGEKSEPAVNGSSASSTASTPASAPAPAPAPSASAASRQRVPPGGFSSGLW